MRYLIAQLPTDSHEPVRLIEGRRMAEEVARDLSDKGCMGIWEYDEDDQRKSWLVTVAYGNRLFRREEHETR